MGAEDGCALLDDAVTQFATVSITLRCSAVWVHDTCNSVSMHSPVEGGPALDDDLAQQRAPLVAHMHQALLTAALAHVQHPLQCTAAAQQTILLLVLIVQQS